MDWHFQRATVLMQQARFDLAEQELRLALADGPDNAAAHAQLALCLNHRDAHAESTKEAHHAIRLAPHEAYAHYTLAIVLLNRNRFEEAEAAISEALRIDPTDADYYGKLASIRFCRENWRGALAAAEQGLEQDAEHARCNHLRAVALKHLGRYDEANAALAANLARDPGDRLCHAALGWARLHEGKVPEALEFFREALRLDPTLDYARGGMVEALKSRFRPYGLTLRYFLWMRRFGRRARWGLVIGLFAALRLLGMQSQDLPELVPLIIPLLILYSVFAVSTWIASPLSDLLLRLNRFGRHALSADERRGSTLVGILLALALASLGWLLLGGPYGLLGAVYFGFLLLPASAIFKCDKGWPRALMASYTVGLAGLMPASFLVSAFASPDAGDAVGAAFLLGGLLSGLVAKPLASTLVRH